MIKKRFKKLFGICFIAMIQSSMAQVLLPNGGFENNFTNWSNLSGDGAISTYSISTDTKEGSKSMKVSISALGANVYSIQTIHSGWVGIPGKVYKINFYAKSLKTGSELKFVQTTNGFKSSAFALSTQWEMYEYTYVSGGVSEKLTIQFPNLDTYFVDDLKIEELNILTTPIPASGNSSLKALASNCGLNMANLGDRTNEPDFEKILKNDFNMLGSENGLKMVLVKRTETGAYDFSGPDKMLAYAKANNMKLRGHTIVWHSGLPGWMETKSWTRQSLLAFLKSYIQVVVGRYKGEIDEWDVANEFVNKDANGFRDGTDVTNGDGSIWIKYIGPEVLDSAFKWVHEIDPTAKLYYNDFNAEGMNNKSNFVYNMVKGMKQRGVPIHGVGLQCHFKHDLFLTKNVTLAKEMDLNIKRIGALGLDVAFTEIDLSIIKPIKSDDYIFQAISYGNLLQIALDNPTIVKTFMIWGITDKYTWIRMNNPNADDPLFYTAEYQKKPAYNKMVEVLKANCTTVVAPEINLKQGVNSILNSTGSFEFAPNVAINTTSSPITFTIQNTGNADLIIGDIKIGGANPFSFVVTQLVNKTIRASSFSTFTISYRPTFVGPKSAVVSIVNNDADENPYTFNITAKTTTVTALEEVESNESQRVSIYPNPSDNGIFYLSQNLEWKITSVLGKELKSGNSNEINLSGQPKGVYLVKIHDRIERVVLE